MNESRALSSFALFHFCSGCGMFSMFLLENLWNPGSTPLPTLPVCTFWKQHSCYHWLQYAVHMHSNNSWHMQTPVMASGILNLKMHSHSFNNIIIYIVTAWLGDCIKQWGGTRLKRKIACLLVDEKRKWTKRASLTMGSSPISVKRVGQPAWE